MSGATSGMKKPPGARDLLTRIRDAMAQQLRSMKKAARTDLVQGPYAAATDQALSVTLQIGDAAPDFTLPDQNGDPISLAARKAVLYFYPKDDTPGCTKEACNFRDRWEQLKANNITVLGVSKDSVTSHNKFINKHELPFTLLPMRSPVPWPANRAMG